MLKLNAPSSDDFMSSLSGFTQFFSKRKELRFLRTKMLRIFCELDWSGFEPEASPVQGERYTRFNYQPPKYYTVAFNINNKDME